MENTPHSVKPRYVALVGRPNCGKSTLFNLLTGLHQKTGNFPGVTVDKKTGTATIRHYQKEMEMRFIDLPGLYSLHPRSIDEEVAIQVLTNKENADRPDLTVIVADATNLRRCLFLAGQIIDLGQPCILVLNMMDEAEKANVKIDRAGLSARLGIPVVCISAREHTGMRELYRWLLEPLDVPAHTFVDTTSIAPEAVSIIEKKNPDVKGWNALLLANRLYTNDAEVRKQLETVGFSPTAAQAEESLLRQGVVGQLIADYTGKAAVRPELTTKLDAVLTHRIWGYLIFIAVLLIVFQSIFFLAEYPMNWIESTFLGLSNFCRQTLPEGILTDLFIDGILAGLSGVVVFVPQIALLFFFIAILEDSGYMARVSFIMDRIMRRFGLHGRSLIPLISGMACAVPAIMSTRTIGSWKERLVTIFVTPLMSCSARLPVYTLLISFAVPNKFVFGFLSLQGLAFMALYLIGFISALISALVLRYFVKSKERSWFVMELPVYRKPQWGTIFYTIFDKVKVFLFDAGKVIVAISVVLWMLASFGPGQSFEKIRSDLDHVNKEYARVEETANDSTLSSLILQRQNLEALRLENSYAGHLGKTIEPAIRPLGFDWKIGIALITSFAAREVFVGTMATIYSSGGTEDDMQPIRERLKTERNPETGALVYSAATAASLLIFYVFALQCMSTLAVVKRETKSWKWPLIQFVYMGALAWIMSFAVYQLMK